uniref:Uncharacterized protein n=1 Tax=Biomphalaria glabrata TaxID=6526 RepID=A0A2C9LQX0_BIOGL
MELLQASACVILTVLHAVSAQSTDTPSNSSLFEEANNSTNNSSSAVFSPDNDTLTTEITVTNDSAATNVTDWATNWIENVTDSSLNQTTTTMLPITVTSKTTLSSTISTSTQAQTSSSIQEIVNTTLRIDSTTAKGGSATLIGCIYLMVLSAVVLCSL